MSNDYEVILHVGAGKCGSSSLQAALTRRPILYRKNARPYCYGVLDAHNESLHIGMDVRLIRRMSGYTASNTAKLLLDTSLDRIREQLRVNTQNLVLSCEGWYAESEQLGELLETLDLNVTRAVLYVRPQVPLINSSYWQWGAWSGVDFSTWLENRLGLSQWYTMVSKLKSIDRIQEIMVRPVGADVVDDFFSSVLGVVKKTITSDGRTNSSLDGRVLRLLQHNRDLRPDAHTPAVDFAVSRYLMSAERHPTPWVLSRETIRHILDVSRDDNERLLSVLSPDAADVVRADMRWWSEDAFADRIAEDADPVPIEVDDVNSLSVDMTRTILEMAKRIHALEMQVEAMKRNLASDKG